MIYPTPVFDEFLQAFIITQEDKSFYLDLEGNYDTEFRTIQWTARVNKVQVASPYLVALLQDSSIEVRNIFNPNRVYYRHELIGRSQFVTVCVAQNLKKRYQNRLDDFYLVIKNQKNKFGIAMT